jgi:hypothetical protein
MPRTSSPDFHFIGAGISVRSFTRPQRCRNTIAGSAFPPCTFDSPLKIIASPFHFKLLRSVRFRSRSGALSPPETRFPRRSQALSKLRSTSTPLWVLSNPPDQSVQSFSTSKSSSRRLRNPFTPRFAFFRLRRTHSDRSLILDAAFRSPAMIACLAASTHDRIDVPGLYLRTRSRLSQNPFGYPLPASPGFYAR